MIKSIDMNDVMTPDQLAKYLQLNKDTIYRLIRGRKLSATQIGKSYRILKADVEMFLLANSTRASVRKKLFEKVMAIAARNKNLTSDKLLVALESGKETNRQIIYGHGAA